MTAAAKKLPPPARAELEAMADRVLGRGEQLVGWGEAARLLTAAGGTRVRPTTPWRWFAKGKAGVRLDAVRVGRAWRTSREALARFAVDLAVAERVLPPPDGPTPREVASAAERAEREFDRRTRRKGRG